MEKLKAQYFKEKVKANQQTKESKLTTNNMSK